jgi:glycosyltransferase involved in cell wall biosynthesis
MLVKQIKTPLSIIVPVLNEAENLQLLFKRVDQSLTTASIPYEIIVVDDHSIDDTVSVIKNADSRYNVKIIEKEGKPGKAFSLLEGFAAANFDLVCMIDGDLQYPPEAIPIMYEYIEQDQADIVLTERNINTTSYLRRLSSYVYNLLFVKLLFGISYDTQSGLKLFKKEILKSINISPSPWSFDLEFIVCALEQDYIIASHQIAFGERYAGVPKVKMLGATIEMIRASIRLRRLTTSKIVRPSYRNLQLMKRGSSWIIALLTVTFMVITALHSTASADSLNYVGATSSSSVFQTVKQNIEKPVTDLDKSLTGNKKNTATTPTQNNQSTPTPGSNSSSTTTTNAASTYSSNTPPTTTTGSASNTASQSSGPTDGSSSASTTGSGTSTVPTPTTYQTKNTAYYSPSKLAASSTQMFLKIAAIMIEIGGIFIVLGIIFLGIKPTVIRRQQSHPLRS